jgi:hypothetical protein
VVIGGNELTIIRIWKIEGRIAARIQLTGGSFNSEVEITA